METKNRYFKIKLVIRKKMGEIKATFTQQRMNFRPVNTFDRTLRSHFQYFRCLTNGALRLGV